MQRIIAVTSLFLVIGCGNNSSAPLVQAEDIVEIPPLSLEVRYIDWEAGASFEKTGETLMDVDYGYRHLFFQPSEAALILMDVWDRSVNDELTNRFNLHVRTNLSPVLEHARSLGMHIIHTPHVKGSETTKIHPLALPLPGESVFDGPSEREELDAYLIDNGIRYVFYVGYASNMCLINRPTGVFEIGYKLGYEIILIRDASLAVEAPRLFPDGMIHKVMVSLYERWGSSVSVDTFLTL